MFKIGVWKTSVKTKRKVACTDATQSESKHCLEKYISKRKIKWYV